MNTMNNLWHDSMNPHLLTPYGVKRRVGITFNEFNLLKELDKIGMAVDPYHNEHRALFYFLFDQRTLTNLLDFTAIPAEDLKLLPM